jgi:hypothetical protein
MRFAKLSFLRVFVDLSSARVLQAEPLRSKLKMLHHTRCSHK